jgi:hypothetical protein
MDFLLYTNDRKNAIASSKVFQITRSLANIKKAFSSPETQEKNKNMYFSLTVYKFLWYNKKSNG